MISGKNGSGKSYTLSNTSNGTHGIIPLAINDIFNILDSSSTDYEYKTKVSYIWINRGDVYDLLHDSKIRLTIRESVDKGTYIPLLTKQRVYSVNEVVELLNKSNSILQQSTSYPCSTSFCTTIFYLSLKIRNKLTNEIVHSKFQCIKIGIDLFHGRARSRDESGKVIRNRIHETQYLKRLCAILASRKQNRFIPWRDSKLTRLLTETFNNNGRYRNGSRVSLIVNLSPDNASLEASVSSIQFANLANLVSF
jgi:hypothetical protein